MKNIKKWKNINKTDGFNKQIKDLKAKIDEKFNNKKEVNKKTKGFIKKSKETIIAKNIEKNKKKNFQLEFSKLK